MSRRGTGLVAGGLWLASAGCGLLTGPSPSMQLSAALARWDAAGLEHYEMELIRGCYCGWADAGHRVTVRVLDGVPSEAWYTASDLPIEAAGLADLPTVEQLFLLIAQAITNGADDLRVSYHDTHGAPATISIDYYRHAIDDELGITVFQVRDLAP